MEFKKSEIPKDAVSTTEIDSIAKFLAHVSIFDLVIKNIILSSFIVLDWLERALATGTGCIPHHQLLRCYFDKEESKFSGNLVCHLV